MKRQSAIRRLLGRALMLWGALSLLCCAAGAGLMLTASWWLPVEDAPRKADVIVLLAGDPRRAPHAAELYLRGFAPVIYTGRPAVEQQEQLRSLGLPIEKEEERTTAALLAKGVPQTAIHLYGNGLKSTVDEVEHLAAVLPAGAKTILVVTSPYHCRRTKLIMERKLPGCELLFSPPPYEPLPQAWWKNQQAAAHVIMECAKFAFYFTGTPFRSAP